MMKKKKRGISLVGLLLVIAVVVAVIIIVPKILKKKGFAMEKFTIDMLNNNGIGPSATEESLKQKFPDIKNTNTYVEVTTGDNIKEYSARGITAMFREGKLKTFIVTNSDTNFSFNGIKIGDSKEKVLDSFYSESENKDVLDKDGVIQGKFIYGSYTVDNLEDIKTKDKVEYAYIGNENTALEGYYDYAICFVYMEPPYVNSYATKYDNIARIEIGIKDEVVATFASQVLPLRK